MKITLSFLISFIPLSAFATLGIALGVRSNSIDASSYTNPVVSFTSPAQISGAASIFYEHNFNSWFGVRTGLGIMQETVNSTYTGAITGNTTTSGLSAVVPLLINVSISQRINILAGGYYWTLNSVSCSVTGSSLGVCGAGLSGAGFGPKVGLGIKLTPTNELDLTYEPSAQIAPAVGTGHALTVTSITVDYVHRF